MSLELPFGIRPLNPVPTDAYRYNTSDNPYTNIAEAKSEISSLIRYKGMTVFVLDGSDVVEYWWKAGTTDPDLVLKETGSDTLGGLSDVNLVGVTYSQLLTPNILGDWTNSNYSISNDVTLVADSAELIPTQHATKRYSDTTISRINQSFNNISDADFGTSFDNSLWTANVRFNGLTANRTITLSNYTNGAQMYIHVYIAAGDVGNEIIFDDGNSPPITDIVPDYINLTTDGVILAGDALEATKYKIIAVYDSNEWWIDVIDRN